MRDPLQTSTETEKGSSRIPFSQQAWTLDTLKVHFDSRIEDLRRYFADNIQTMEQTNRDRFTAAEKAVTTAMAASEKAVLKAENAAEKRAEASNEIRAAMVDQQGNFADKAGTEMQFIAQAQRITELKESINARLDKIDLLMAASSAKDEGKGAAMSQTTALIFALLGAAGVVITIAMNAFR